MEHCTKLFEELEDLEANGLSIDLDNLEDYGIACSGDDNLTARGIQRHEDGHFTVKFKTRVLSGGDLKALVALWGISSCSADQPCPWCLINKMKFGLAEYQDNIDHRLPSH